MKRYIILRSDDIGSLEVKVNLHVEQGYVPQGGVVNTDRAYSRYLQAVWLPESVVTQREIQRRLDEITGTTNESA